MNRIILAILVFLCPVSMEAQQLPDWARNSGLTVAELTVLEKEISRVSEAARINRAALISIAETLFEETPSNGEVDLAIILSEIRSRASRTLNLEAELERLAQARVSPDTPLIDEAREAFARGDIVTAEALLADVTRFQKRQIVINDSRIAIVLMQRGILAILRGEDEAAEALLDDAIDAFYSVLDRLNRDDSPIAWARAQYLMGNTIVLRFSVNQDRSIALAVVAYAEALTVFRYDNEPELWLSIQESLANLFLVIEGSSENSSKSILLITDQVISKTDCSLYAYHCGWAYRFRGESLSKLWTPDADYSLDDARAAFSNALEYIDQDVQTLNWSEVKALEGALLGVTGQFQQALEPLRQAEDGFKRVGDTKSSKATRESIDSILTLLEELEQQ